MSESSTPKGEDVLEKYIIDGGQKLTGEVPISGAKNAVVAILAGTILAEGPCLIQNIPNISDVSILLNILHEMGASIHVKSKHTIEIDASKISVPEVPYEQAKRMRASYYFLGALLGKFNQAKVSLPGGCNFGVRPIDQHLKGFKALGGDWSLEHGMIHVEATKLCGTNIYLDMVSVGATINIMLAAVKAEGVSIIENAAREPHIVDLANFLNSMGAQIMGAGTDVIKIKGVQHLSGVEYAIIPDQIEAGTYMALAASTKGDLWIRNVIPKHLEPISSKLRKMGVDVIEYDDAVRVAYQGSMQTCNIKTLPHPGFPTDMQPQFTAILCLAQGTSIMTEGVWDNRFRYVDELRRMGANISVNGRVAVIEGMDCFLPAPVKAVDLRAGAAMVIAALSADGMTEIEDIYHVERGYEDIEQKLRQVGARIKKISQPAPTFQQAL